MEALRFYAPHDARLEDIPEPACGEGEIKIRVKNCSACGTDLKTFRNGHREMTPVTTMGHEIAGEIVEIGRDVVGNWKVGDRVQSIAAVPCGDCYECAKNWPSLCQNQKLMGFWYDGGFAEYMIIPAAVLDADGLNRIPDGVAFAEASAAEPLACALNAQEQLGIEEGDVVVVFGAGPIGCMHVRIARGVYGAGKVIMVNRNPDRMAIAADLVKPDVTIDSSATDVVAEVMALTGGRGADVIITATPSGKNQEQAVAMAARNGRISFFGGLPKDSPTITLDSNLVHYRQLHIHGANASAPAQHRKAMEYIATGQLPVADLITKHVPLAEAEGIFDALASGQDIKVTVEP
ncbi:zinc-dependent dehydrogenase [Ancrocorticia populi]|uniref:Alcohol dehydrogenase n=3 Tax=Ancrocorticia populi TaxID=2175228 RepID=A0A2V1KDT8_9ACTO|nr:zinc-dependent dehydrogenase [Ancrocorticia populi]PWF27114.1 alcohol dehydrogenase [Ancrocorticia populi]